MNLRIAKALVSHIRNIPGASKFILMEGLPAKLAEGIAAEWPKSGFPPLLVGSDEPSRFGARALVNQSGTQLRNQNSGGVCIILCEGYQIPDWQSVAKFKSVSLSDLVQDRHGLARLAEAARQVDLSQGILAQVRQAILGTPSNAKPTVFQVAKYFDAIAVGQNELDSLPLIGAFPDRDPADGFTKDRLIENFQLSRRRFLEKASQFNEIRRRAAKVFSRPGSVNRDPGHFISLLQTGSPEALSAITFDEAREILNDQAPNLIASVQDELSAFRTRVAATASPDQEDLIPWEHYAATAKALLIGSEKKSAADELLEFHKANSSKVFEATTAKKLGRFLKDRTVIATYDSPEVAIIRCADTLESELAEIRVPGAEWANANLSGPRSLVLALAAMKLRPLLKRLESEKLAVIDGLLLLSPATILASAEEDLFYGYQGAADVNDPGLPPIQIKVMGKANRDSVEFRWAPSLDDVALLRTVIAVTKADGSLRLDAGRWPSPGGICAARELRPVKCRPENAALGARLGTLAAALLERGLESSLFSEWAAEWAQAAEAAGRYRNALRLTELALAGSIQGDETTFGLGLLSPLKAEWISKFLEDLRDQAFLALSQAGKSVSDESAESRARSAEALARGSSNHYPPFLRVTATDQPLLPVYETRLWSVMAREFRQEAAPYAEQAVARVIQRLLKLQPEAARHLKCMAFGPDAATILVRRLSGMIGKKVGRELMRRCEIYCVGQRPDDIALKDAEAELGQERRGLLALRYFKDLREAQAALKVPADVPVAHFALVSGLSSGSGKFAASTVEIRIPDEDGDVALTPKTWIRPKGRQRMLLAPAGASPTCATWLKLMTALDDAWPEDDIVRVPEVQTSSEGMRSHLQGVHDLALWVATVDRFASRETIERAVGPDVAILHQECRLSSEFPLGLVISQKSGSQADRAIASSLRDAGILTDEGDAGRVGRKLREVASQGYGILALEAATTGYGINELVAHVVSFSLIQSEGVPWPFPEGCRVLLISLDEYAHWFGNGKRADLLALALDPEGEGVYTAVIEVKARRGDANTALGEALEQIRFTLADTKAAAHADRTLLEGRIWRNRIAEAACSVAREINFRLDEGELKSIEAFRRGTGVLEWGGVGLVFGPNIDESNKHTYFQRYGDRVPIATRTVKLTKQVLDQAIETNLTELRTVRTDHGPLPGGRERRRPEKRPEGEQAEPILASEETVAVVEPSAGDVSELPVQSLLSITGTEQPAPLEEPIPLAETAEESAACFQAPLLGWRTDRLKDREVHWQASGPGSNLSNPHIEIWGASGAGKTQFTMALLAQLSLQSGCRFGIADFKNDYNRTDRMDFPAIANADFIDLWREGARYNPLALNQAEESDIKRAVIEFNDIIASAARSFMNMGHKQQSKLKHALTELYAEARSEGRWPTLADLGKKLDTDLRPILEDLTGNPIFRDGPSMGEILNRRIVFGLHEIPGSGLTTVLTGGFILSSIWERVLKMPQTHSVLRYLVVVDEAHRVSKFKVIDTMIREGRSKGLGVILATQQPSDLPEVAGTQAQTKICFRLDPAMAKVAAKRLDPDSKRLEETIRNLDDGEAIIKLGKGEPTLIKAVQLYRDVGMIAGIPV